MQTPPYRLFALLVAAGLAVLVGCSSTRLTESPTSSRTDAKPTTAAIATPAQRPTTAAPAQAAQSTVRNVTLHPLDDPKSGLLKRSVFFDFDSFVIHDEDRSVIDSHAKYLSSSRSAKGCTRAPRVRRHGPRPAPAPISRRAGFSGA